MKKLKKTENAVSKSIGRAIAENSLIENNDRILVGVSGGKDSLTLLKILLLRKKWMPIKYDITACHVLTNNICLGCCEIEELRRFFNALDCDYIFEKSEIVDDKRAFSCFWCAWNRRKALFKLAEKRGFTKIALGHNMDDVVATMLMNLFFHGEIASLNPKQSLFGGKITIIRPMIYLEEKKILLYAREAQLPKLYCNCPNAKRSKRQHVGNLVQKLEKEFKYVKKNIMNAPHRIREEYLGARYG